MVPRNRRELARLLPLAGLLGPPIVAVSLTIWARATERAPHVAKSSVAFVRAPTTRPSTAAGPAAGCLWFSPAAKRDTTAFVARSSTVLSRRNLTALSEACRDDLSAQRQPASDARPHALFISSVEQHR